MIHRCNKFWYLMGLSSPITVTTTGTRVGQPPNRLYILMGTWATHSYAYLPIPTPPANAEVSKSAVGRCHPAWLVLRLSLLLLLRTVTGTRHCTDGFFLRFDFDF
jgi:hypothetical protein